MKRVPPSPFISQIPGTVSISEPEVLLPFVAGSTLTKADPREGEERSKLLRACIEVLCVTAINRKLKDGVKNISYVVIKPKVEFNRHCLGSRVAQCNKLD